MYGPASLDPNTIVRSMPTDQSLSGIIPRAIQEIFELASNAQVISLSVYCSFVQIYNENLYDLLR